MLLQNSSQIFFPEETGSVITCLAPRVMVSTAHFAAPDYDCSYPSLQLSAHFDDNSEDIKSTGSKGGDDPDSAELFHASDQDSCRDACQVLITQLHATCHVRVGQQLRRHQRNVVSG